MDNTLTSISHWGLFHFYLGHLVDNSDKLVILSKYKSEEQINLLYKKELDKLFDES